jgi:apolipoprotein D and lipocalin family protein
MRSTFVLIASTVLVFSSCTSKHGPSVPPPAVVPRVDLERYAGTWHEIASYPNRFQKGCSNTNATYTLRKDGKIEVINRCRRNGREDSVKGSARVSDKTTNAKLKVTFFWPFYGDYWIIDLGESYDYAVVSNPDRKYLWILGRTPQLDEARYTRILERMRGKGFDVDKLVKTNQDKTQ